MNKAKLGLLIIASAVSLNCYAGFFDWLIPPKNAPNDKRVTASNYGLSGGELNSVSGEQVSDETINKFKEASQLLSYAKLSGAVYDGKTEEGAWERIDDKVGDLGFHASTYRNRGTGQVVVAFQGTCGGGGVKSCIGDIATDIDGLVITSPQQIQAVEYVKKITQTYGNNVQVTGHSLGGGLAQTAAAVFGLEAVTFNSATVNWTTKGLIAAFNQQPLGTPKITNVVMTGDPVNPGSKVFGKDYGKNIYLDFDFSILPVEHSLEFIETALTVMSTYYNNVLSKIPPKDIDAGIAANIAKINASLAKNNSIAIVQSGSSHIGSASFGYQVPMTGAGSRNQSSSLYGANYKETTGYNATPSSAYSSAQSFAQSAWVVTTGDAAEHFRVSNNYGSISPALNSPIYSLNNADVPYTIMEKKFAVPYNVTSANVSSIMNFVTTEYPVFVGSQFNDKGIITITTPGGKSITATLFNASVNGSSFSPAIGMPAPLDGFNPNDGAGQTGWINANKIIPVAPGGKLTVQVKVINAGDTQFPSAVLINKLNVK